MCVIILIGDITNYRKGRDRKVTEHGVAGACHLSNYWGKLCEYKDLMIIRPFKIDSFQDYDLDTFIQAQSFNLARKRYSMEHQKHSKTSQSSIESNK